VFVHVLFPRNLYWLENNIKKIEEEEIDDPEDKKPEGYDDIPATTVDKEAKKPDDWLSFFLFQNWMRGILLLIFTPK
jgi:hypothetical protein